jgi:hypothetical protein
MGAGETWEVIILVHRRSGPVYECYKDVKSTVPDDNLQAC